MIASFAAPTPTSYAARAGLEAVNALTFEVDPSVGAGHSTSSTLRATVCRFAMRAIISLCNMPTTC